ncbi:UNVERIFIED_CONTAM: hypothetical protein FKN15_060745 [Acipenser sinensis]
MEDPADSGGSAPAGPSMLVTEIHCSAGARPLRLLEWKVKPGSHVNIDSVLAVCIPIPVERQAGEEPRDPPSGQAEKKVKSDRAGVVRELCCQPGQVISPGCDLLFFNVFLRTLTPYLHTELFGCQTTVHCAFKFKN